MHRHNSYEDNSISLQRSEFSMPDPEVTTSCYEAIDAAKAQIGRSYRALLEQLARYDEQRLDHGGFVGDAAAWLCAHLGISRYRAMRYVACGYALRHLPLVAHAIEDGSLVLEKALELSRFATPTDEGELVSWAKKVSLAAIATRADELDRAEENVPPIL